MGLRIFLLFFLIPIFFSLFFYGVTRHPYPSSSLSAPVYIRQRWLSLQPPPTHCNRSLRLFLVLACCCYSSRILLCLVVSIGLDLRSIVNGGCCSFSSSGAVPEGGGDVAQGRRPEGGASGARRRGGERDARPGRGRQLRRPRRHRKDPPQLQVQSDHRGVGDEGAGAPLPRPGAQRQHDHHRLLDARHDRIRAPQARQGVVSAQGDPGGDHVVGERAQPDQPVPGGGSRGLPAQARPPLRRVASLQPDQMITRHVGSWRKI